MDDFAPVLVCAIVFISFGWMIRLFLDYRTRTRLIDRGLVDENVKYLYAVQQDGYRSTTLKWGIILVAIGSALFVGELFPYYISHEMTVACAFLFSGIGLLLYYWFGPKKPTNGHSAPPHIQ